MTPTELHERLDSAGWLADSHDSGVYALRVRVPDDVEAIQREWLASSEGPLPDAYAEQLADAETSLYVGASTDVYSRLMDHARGQVRQASFVAAFDLVDVAGVWPGDRSGVAERDRARALSDGETCVWCDGELL